MKKFIALLLVLLTLLPLVGCGILANFRGVTLVDIEGYEEKRAELHYAKDFLPTLSDLGEYVDISYSYKLTPILLFQSDTIALWVEYSPEVYEERKAALLSSYTFLEETQISPDGEQYLSPPAAFTYKDYSFQTAVNSSNYSYCKSFALIGVNDEKCQIAYLYFYDIDLDYIDTTTKSEQECITKFIDKYFYWNDIKD